MGGSERPSLGVPHSSREWLFRHSESVGRRLRAVSSASGFRGAGVVEAAGVEPASGKV